MASRDYSSLYNALPNNRFRIFSLEPLQGDGKIKGHIKQAAFDPNLEYFALSYTWACPVPGTPDRADSEIEIDGVPFMIQDNLFQCLCRLLKESEVQIGNLWIDAICINQKDDQEKAKQVSIMGQIYQSARKVLIWLGPHDGHLQDAVKLIKSLCAITDTQRRQIRPDTLTTITSKNLIGKCSDRGFWISLAIFFSRAWFVRAWVMQEVILAKSFLIFCGDLPSNSLTWEELVLVSDFLATSIWTHALRSQKFLKGLPIDTHVNGPTVLNAAKISLHRGDDPLLYNLIRSRRYVCQDEKDKVFSVYSVARGNSTYTSLLPAPDYKMTASEVYIATAVSVLRGSKDLLLLAYAEGKDFRNHNSLPSWVPDWSIRDIVGLGVTGYRRFWASGDLQRDLHIHDSHRIISIRAAAFDEINAVGESKRHVTSESTFPQWLDIIQNISKIYCTGEYRMDVFWRTLITNTGPSGDDFPSTIPRVQFRHWLLKVGVHCHQKRDTNQDATDTLKKLADLFEAEGPDSIVPSPTEIITMAQSMDAADRENNDIFLESDAFETILAHTPCLRLFTTKLGLLGKGSQSLCAGDTIFIVPGLRVPLILRRLESHVSTKQRNLEKFEVVGGAYVHGFMRGEALQRPLDFQSVELS
ncbi:HET-domain-containing protein [Viridothelium virens]|uniref:HET-domain-containing protein n=1 Tax=Viridothelium virens TaxID=1048519 RepID=A0A6A6H0K4_VIRVR|nr:HET-domain-containing protein [Viridothelium virens]